MKGYFGKFLIVTVLSLLCLIPLGMVGEIVHERNGLQQQVGYEIAMQHGGAQHLTAPVLAVRFMVQHEKKQWVLEKTTSEQHKETQLSEREYVLLYYPKTTRVQGALAAKELHRGIYSIPAYTAELDVSGSFSPISLPQIGAPYDGGTVISVTSLRMFMPVKSPQGIAAPPTITWEGQSLAVEAGSGGVPVGSDAKGFSAEIVSGTEPEKMKSILAGKEDFPFTISLYFQGAHSLSFLPKGGEYTVDLQSAWPHPQFQGDFLPLTREVVETGFKARWSVTEFSNAARGNGTYTLDWNEPSFSVELIEPVDIYLQSTRAVKYGILFILLTFEAFLLFEVLRGLRIHPVQYLLVGAALSVFYLLLISLSEHVGFARAYVAASTACVLLLGWYVRSVVKSIAGAIGFSASLSVLYGALYLILLSEQYALAMGSSLLFSVLVATMYLTKNVDWYALEGGLDYKRFFCGEWKTSQTDSEILRTEEGPKQK